MSINKNTITLKSRIYFLYETIFKKLYSTLTVYFWHFLKLCFLPKSNRLIPLLSIFLYLQLYVKHNSPPNSIKWSKGNYSTLLLVSFWCIDFSDISSRFASSSPLFIPVVCLSIVDTDTLAAFHHRNATNTSNCCTNYRLHTFSACLTNTVERTS